MPARPIISLDDLATTVSAKFDEAQSSIANHRKNCVALHKIQLQASEIKGSGRNKDILEGELAFGDVFIHMLNRMLAVKKGTFADRIVRFVGSYIKMMNDKILEEAQQEEETFASRFITRLLEWLFQGFKARNKVVRQRSLELVIEMMANIGEIDESTYNQLRDNLIDRLCDKEALIRAHAAIALSKLAGAENPDELKSGEKTCLDMILECVQYDTAPEVRRAALVNLPVTPETLPVVITRTRDTDTLTRKLAYSAVLEPKLGHPRHLTIAQREEITKAGLGDREAVVRVASSKMIMKWLDIAMSETPDSTGQPQSWEGDDGGVMKGFINFLTYFDVVGPGEIIAVDAMLSVFTTKPALLDAFVFGDDYWEDLSPESAVLARVFVEQCLETNNENRLETASIPVVTAFAFHIQQAYNGLLSLMQEMDFLNVGEPDDEESEAREEELAKKEMILGELMRIAVRLDYMDEIGRRKIFSVVKDMLAHPHLPPGLIERCLDVLYKILPSERELIRIVVEIIIELRDDDVEPVIEDDNFDGSRSDITQTTFSSKKDRSMRRSKQRQEMTAEEQHEADLTDMRCLVLCIGMLERVNGTFEDNSTLEGVLTDLIIPAVKRKELTLREKGLVALGLCCLIARNMATNSFQLFLNQVQTAPEELKLKVLQIVFDLLIMYDREFLGRSEEISQQIVSFILQTLDAEESSATQSVVSIGICKLLLSGQVTDSKVLLSLVLTYISPSTMDNVQLKQCLAYFFPVYCYSSRENQSRLQSIFIAAFDHAVRLHEELEDEQKEDTRLVSLHQFGLLMIDWLDMAKLVEKVPPPKPTDRNPHADLALDILLALYDSERGDDIRKTFCQFLGQLQLFSSNDNGLQLDNRIVLKLNILVENLQEQCPFDDASLDRIFNRVKERFRKTFAKRLERIDPGRFVDAEFKKFYEEIGMELPDPTAPHEDRDDNGEFEEIMKAATQEKERTEVPEDEEDLEPEEREEEEPVSPIVKNSKSKTSAPSKAKGKSRSTRKRKPTEEEEQEQREEAEEQPGSVEKSDSEEREEPSAKEKLKPKKGSARLKSKSKVKSRFTKKARPTEDDDEEQTEQNQDAEDNSSLLATSRMSGMSRIQSTSNRRSTTMEEAEKVQEDDEDPSDGEEQAPAATDLIPAIAQTISSPMKKAGKRTRASQADNEAGPSRNPVSPVRKKRAGTRSRMVDPVARDPSPSPKPKAVPKRGKGSRAVGGSFKASEEAEEREEEEAEVELGELEEVDKEQAEEEDDEEPQRQPPPSPKPKLTRNSRSKAGARGSDESTKTNGRAAGRTSGGKENTRQKSKGKGRASVESSKLKATVPGTRRSRRVQEQEPEIVDGFDSDI